MGKTGTGLPPIGRGRHQKNRAPTNPGREAVRAQIKLARLLGVELGPHYRWLLIAVLIELALGDHFLLIPPAWSSTVVWSISVAAGVLFFVFLFAHELSHALVAKARGLPIHKMSLFALGGMAQI